MNEETLRRAMAQDAKVCRQRRLAHDRRMQAGLTPPNRAAPLTAPGTKTILAWLATHPGAHTKRDIIAAHPNGPAPHQIKKILQTLEITGVVQTSQPNTRSPKEYTHNDHA